jgi:flagellin
VADDTDIAVTAGATTIETDGATAAGANATTEPTRTTISIAATVTALDYNSFITSVDGAIDVLNADINTLGINQRTLSSKELQLAQAITTNSAAESRIMDTDFAKEQSNAIRLQILQQTATAALSQANMGPQAVLGFLG